MNSFEQSGDEPAELAARYGRVLQRAPFPAVECTAEGRIVRWNDAAARLFGYTEEEAIGRSVVGTLLLPGEEELFRRVLQEDHPGELRTWLGTRKDGLACACVWACQPILDAQGGVAGVTCLGQEAPAHVAPVPEDQGGRILRAIVDNLDVAVFEIDREGVYTFHDGKALQLSGVKPGQFLGQKIVDMYGPDAEPMLAMVNGDEVHQSSNEVHERSWNHWFIPVRGDEERGPSLIGVSLDITELRRVEREAQARLELLERQREVIRELSTPIIEVWEGVLALPMIGVIDNARTAEVMENLLEAIVRRQARFAVLDLTGVEVVDTRTASYLIHLIRAIGLLGAEGIITGIRPSVAQTLVELGVDLGNVTTLANLRAGLRHCIARAARARGWRSTTSSGMVGGARE